MGVIQAARIGGAPIVPVAFGASRRKAMGSWDAFIVPYPFSKGVFVYGEPIEVLRSANNRQMETARRELEEKLRSLTRRAEEIAEGSEALASHAGAGHV
jgi:lysophospholipid acyltransferase (LPLAT)-like uncharacterized protein